MTYFLGGVTGQDDPLNASTLGAPAIIRGTIYAHQIAGLVIGAGQTTLVRQTNATILQTAINYACSNGKILVMEPGIYEINSSTGLTIPAQGAGNYGLVLRGSRTGTVISQFYNTTPSAPVLTIGDTTGVTLSSGVDISGLTLKHGVSQTGFTSAHGLVVGFCANGRISDLTVSNTTNPSYDGIQFASGCSGMVFRNIAVAAFQHIGLNFLSVENSNSAINNFDTIDVSGGATATYSAVTNFMSFGAGTYNDMLFNGLTARWGACNIMFAATSGGIRGLTINGLHVEGIKLTGASPVFFDLAQDSILINGFKLVDPIVLSGNLSGSPYLFRDFTGAGSDIQVNNFVISVLTGTAGSEVNTNFGLFGTVGGALGDSLPIFEISKFALFDNAGGNFSGHMFVDDHMPMASFATPQSFHRYSRGASGSKIDSSVINVSATYTHYGQSEDVTILVPGVITSFTLTLATTQGATGTKKPRTGTTVHVRRLSGTVTGTLTVAFGGTGTPTTNTTSTDLFYQFDGTTWQTFTQVT